MNLSHYGFHVLIVLIITVVKADRIEAIPKVPQVREQANRAGWASSQTFYYEVTDSLLEWQSGIAKMVSTPEEGKINLVARPEEVPGE